MHTNRKAANKHADIIDRARIMFSAATRSTSNHFPISFGHKLRADVPSSSSETEVEESSPGTTFSQNDMYGPRKLSCGEKLLRDMSIYDLDFASNCGHSSASDGFLKKKTVRSYV